MPVTEAHKKTFADDGVVKVERAVSDDWIERLLAVADEQLATPGRWITDSNPGGLTDRLFTTRYLWREHEVIRAFALDSGVAGMVGELLGVSTLRLYFDHLLVKEPHTTNPTPWHQDIPYWPFLGKQIASAWVALTPATVEESSLEFIRGSHAWDAYYAPEAFGSGSTFTDSFEGEKMPDIEADRSSYDIVGFDVEPGDAIVFNAWAVHGAPGNAGPARRAALSTRWLGDDVTWAPHPGSDPIVTEEHVSIAPGDAPIDDDRFPVAWYCTADS